MARSGIGQLPEIVSFAVFQHLGTIVHYTLLQSTFYTPSFNSIFCITILYFAGNLQVYQF